MLLIFGTRAYETLIVLIMMVCPNCHVEAQQQVTKVANKFTLFFIPLFAVSTKYFVECSNCHALTPLSQEQAEHSAEWVSTHGGSVER